MSGMADEMNRRLQADEGAGLIDAGAVPGNVDAPPPPGAPPAGAQNTETAPDGGPPDAIPYARFKEVNDRLSSLRGYEQLSEYGYDPDSLGRLAAFEAQWLQDPIGTWKTLGDNLDLPQELKDAIETHVTAASSGRAEGEPIPEGGKPADLPPEVKSSLEYVDQLRQRDAEQARNEQLGRVVSHWDKLDTADKIETPERIKLMAIASMAGSGHQFRTIEELAEAARSTILDYRSETLGGAIQRTGHAGAPSTLPGSAPAPSAPLKFTTIKDASKAAEAAILRGELPAIES